MSTLQVFDQDDVNRIVFHLKLPPFERRKNSALVYRLLFIEREDQRNGTDIATRIKFLLDELDRLDEVINTETGTPEGTATAGLVGNQQSVADMYSQSEQYSASSGQSEAAPPGQVSGYWYLYKKYYRELRRELLYVRYDSQIPIDGVAYSSAHGHYGLLRGDVVG